MQATNLQWSVSTIGEVAGQVWQCLKRDGKTSLAEIEKRLESPSDLTFMAIGWLAREGKLDLSQKGRSVQLWLTE